MKYLSRVRPWGLSSLDSKAKRTEPNVNRITQLRLLKVIFCLTMMTDRKRVNTNWDDKRREEVDTGR